MKLQLTVFAQDLKAAVEEEDANADANADAYTDFHPFAVVAKVHSTNKATEVLGKTEVLRNTWDPDFTKIFILDDFELGKPMQVMVTLHDSRRANQKIGSSILFDVGAVLGTKGGVSGKQIHPAGGYVMVHVEPTLGLGTLHLQLRGSDLKSPQNKQVDPYFELQTRRKTTSGKSIWDVIFRSVPVENTKNPAWSDVFVDLGLLCGGNKNEKFRISVKDYDDKDDTLIGSCFATVNELLLAAVTMGRGGGSMDNAERVVLPLMRPRPMREVGKIIVASASIGDSSGPTTEPDILFDEVKSRAYAEEMTDDDDDDDIVLESTETDEIEILPEDLNGETHFADYIAGGCELRVIVAIDYTASNGDPRKEESLHHFKKDGKNMYEETISMICTILSEFDSDKKFPVYGFGAKKGGTLSHCFPVGDEKEVEGVEGILSAYRGAFKTGMVMSKPTNITEIIAAAGRDAQHSFDAAAQRGSQVYTILTIFTNGNVHSVGETIAALETVQGYPLSVVVVGVGPSDFGDMTFLNQCQRNNGTRVHFVDTKLHQGGRALSEATLSVIPEQLVRYFTSKGIRPNPPIETDEIVIEPFHGEEGQEKPDISVSENGEISVEASNNTTGSVHHQPTPPAVRLPAPLTKGKNMILNQAKRQFGRVSNQIGWKFNRVIDQKVNKLFTR